MKLIAVLLLFSAGLQAQTVWQLPLWSGKGSGWFTLGRSFVVQINPDGTGTVDVMPAPPAPVVQIHQHVTGAILTAVNGVYQVPANATNVEVFRNGLLQFESGDYTFTGGTIKPLHPIAWAESLIIAKYQIP